MAKVSSCSNAAATIVGAESDRTLLRFVPLKSDDSIYRIVVAGSSKCARFLSASAECDDKVVQFAREDRGKGLQRWLFTKVYESPQVVSSVASGPRTAVVSFEPTQDAVNCTVRLEPGSIVQAVAPLTYPQSQATITGLRPSQKYVTTVSCTMEDGYQVVGTDENTFTTMAESPTIVSASATGYTSAEVVVEVPESAEECSATLDPTGKTQTAPASTSPITFSFSGLSPSTEYSVTVQCALEDGSVSSSLQAVSFVMPEREEDPAIVSASATGYTSAEVVVEVPESAEECSATLDPTGKTQTAPASTSPITFSFSGLSPSTEYSVTVQCTLDDGSVSSSPQAASFIMPVENYPEDGSEYTYCNGLGEIIVDSKCVCDKSRQFIPTGKGGCECEDKRTVVDGACGCDSALGYTENESGECECNADLNLVLDGAGCSCNADKNYVSDGKGGCKSGLAESTRCCDPVLENFDIMTRECVPKQDCDPSCEADQVCLSDVCVGDSDSLRISAQWLDGPNGIALDADLFLIAPGVDGGPHCITFWSTRDTDYSPDACPGFMLDYDSFGDAGTGSSVENILFLNEAKSLPAGTYYFGLMYFFTDYDASLQSFNVSLSVRIPEDRGDIELFDLYNEKSIGSCGSSSSQTTLEVELNKKYPNTRSFDISEDYEWRDKGVVDGKEVEWFDDYFIQPTILYKMTLPPPS